jgi:hypothetical protein
VRLDKPQHDAPVGLDVLAVHVHVPPLGVLPAKRSVRGRGRRG